MDKIMKYLEEINNHFYYDETSPTFLRWKKNYGKFKIGQPAGYVNNGRDNYCTVRVGLSGKYFLVHRVVWAIHYGKIDTTLQIDHVDQNPLNNNISNLRLVKAEVNARNHSLQRNNTSGVVGVSYHAQLDGYCCQWHDANKRKQKFFSCNKYGNLNALELACEYRRKVIAEMNINLGAAGYTDRHGT